MIPRWLAVVWHIPWSEGGRKGGRKISILSSSRGDRRGWITSWRSHRFIFYPDGKNPCERQGGRGLKLRMIM